MNVINVHGEKVKIINSFVIVVVFHGHLFISLLELVYIFIVLLFAANFICELCNLCFFPNLEFRRVTPLFVRLASFSTLFIILNTGVSPTVTVQRRMSTLP